MKDASLFLFLSRPRWRFMLPLVFLLGIFSLFTSSSTISPTRKSIFSSNGKKDDQRGRFILFPFTQYGPNVQLMGLKHTLAICQHLDILCVEPGFSDLFAKNFYNLSDFFVVDSKLLLPRSRLADKHLRPDVFLYGLENRHGQPRWPSRQYFKMHGIDYQPPPAPPFTVNNTIDATHYARTRQCADQKQSRERNVKSTLRAVQEELALFRKRPKSHDQEDCVVALVYSAALGDARHDPPEPLTRHYVAASRALVPTAALQQEAQAIRTSLFPRNEAFIAMHLRLRDHCKSSIEECCCETSGSLNRLTMFDIEAFAETQMQNLGTRNLFISAPPSIQRMVPEWDWFVRNAATVKVWYSEEMPGLLKESVVQQIICSKARAFIFSVPSSTWSGSVISWMEKGTVVAQLTKTAHIRGPLGNVSKYSMGFSASSSPTNNNNSHDTRLSLSYLPEHPMQLSEPELAYIIELELRLNFISSRRNCNRNETMFGMLRNDGLGASFHFIHLALGIALRQGIPLYTMNIDPKGVWAWGTMCDSNDWDCLFQPTHSCSFSNKELNDIQKQWKNESKPCPVPWCLSWSRRSHFYDMERPLSIGVPNHGVSAVLHRSILTSFLFRLNPSVQSRVDAQTFRYIPSEKNPSSIAHDATYKKLARLVDARTSDDPPIIAMHIRQGDSCKDPRKIRKCFGLHEYMERAIEMRRLYGSDTIIAATDSEEIVANITAYYADWNWFLQDINRKKYDVKDEQEYKRGGHIPGKMARNREGSRDIQLESIADLSALTLGSAFVGTFTSDFSRMAYELACARTARKFKYMPPYASLAGTFCAGGDPITKRPVYSCE